MIIPRSDGVVTNRETTTGQLQSSMTQMVSSVNSAALGIVQTWKDQKDHADIQAAINNSLKKKNEWKAANLAREGKAAEGLTEDYIKFSQEVEKEISQGLSGRARRTYQIWSGRDAEQDKLSVMFHQKKQMDFVKQQNFLDGVSVAEDLVRQDARNWQKGLEHLNNSLDLAKSSGVISEEEFDRKKSEYNNRYRNELGKSYYTQDKHEFMKNINSFGFGKPEIAFWQNKYQDDVRAEEREKKSLYAEEMRALRTSMDDMKAQAVANGDTSHFKQAAEKAKAMGYSLEAKEFMEQARSYDKVIAFNSKTKNMGLREIVNEAGQLKIPENLDGSSSEFMANAAINNEIEKKVKLFHDDPAKYVQAWALGNTPQERADSILSLQVKQGIMPKDGLQILTKEEKNIAKNIWEGGSTEDRVNLVMQTLPYGKHAPKVLEEMKINKALTLSPFLLKDGNVNDVKLLVAGVSNKPEILDDGTKKDYALAAKETELYQHLAKLQSRFPTNGELPQKVADLEKAITGISAIKVDPEAGRNFFDERITTIDSDDKLVYFPNSLDEDEVAGMLDQKKGEIQKSLSRSEDNVYNRKLKMAMRDAVWVNSESGFVLADEKTGAFIPGSEVNLLDQDGIRRDFIQNATKKMKEDQEKKDLATSTFLRR